MRTVDLNLQAAAKSIRVDEEVCGLIYNSSDESHSLCTDWYSHARPIIVCYVSIQQYTYWHSLWTKPQWFAKNRLTALSRPRSQMRELYDALMLSISLFVLLFVCRLWNLLSHSLRGSTSRRAGASRIVSDTLVIFRHHEQRASLGVERWRDRSWV